MTMMTNYYYDASGVLTGIGIGAEQRWRYPRGRVVVNERRVQGDGSAVRITWLRAGSSPVAEQVEGEHPRLTLLGASVHRSVMLEADEGIRAVAYATHGHHAGAADQTRSQLGFAGELREPVAGLYLLGAGHHRPYSPTLGLFLAPDRASPFGRGGLNTLSYCAGDPINRIDPSGHFWKWVIAGVSLALSAVAVAFTAGAAVGVLVGAVALTKSTAASVAATTLGIASIATEVGALAAHEAGADAAGSILGWVGLGLGAVGMVSAVPAMLKASAKAATKLGSRLSRFSQRTRSIARSSISRQSTSSAGSGASGTTIRSARPPSRSASVSSRHSRQSLASRASGRSSSSFADLDIERMQALAANGQERARNFQALDATEMAESLVEAQAQADRWWRSKPVPWTTRDWAANPFDEISMQPAALVNADDHVNVADLIPASPTSSEAGFDFEMIAKRWERAPSYESLFGPPPPPYPG